MHKTVKTESKLKDHDYLHFYTLL